MTKKVAGKILKILREYYGTVQPELHYHNSYQLVLSVILSAHTTDKQVNKVTPVLFDEYPGFFVLSKANVKRIEQIIKSVGLYKTKAVNIVNLAKIIIEKFNGKVPDKFNELILLPGIGRKTANVILAQGFNKPAFAVDTHIARVGLRTGFSESPKPEIVEKAFTDLIPEKEWIQAHLLLIKHGRVLCRARKPECGICPISFLCSYYKRNS